MLRFVENEVVYQVAKSSLVDVESRKRILSRKRSSFSPRMQRNAKNPATKSILVVPCYNVHCEED
jgi:hypothetical protein